MSKSKATYEIIGDELILNNPPNENGKLWIEYKRDPREESARILTIFPADERRFMLPNFLMGQILRVWVEKV